VLPCLPLLHSPKGSKPFTGLSHAYIVTTLSQAHALFARPAIVFQLSDDGGIPVVDWPMASFRRAQKIQTKLPEEVSRETESFIKTSNFDTRRTGFPFQMYMIHDSEEIRCSLVFCRKL